MTITFPESGLTDEQKNAITGYFTNKLFYGFTPEGIISDFLEIEAMKKRSEKGNVIATQSEAVLLEMLRR
jgi:hypothetical protein